MTKITESAIEEYAIKLFEKQNYQYIYAPSIVSNIYRDYSPLGAIEEMVFCNEK